jgi:hypothetical protein
MRFKHSKAGDGMAPIPAEVRNTLGTATAVTPKRYQVEPNPLGVPSPEEICLTAALKTIKQIAANAAASEARQKEAERLQKEQAQVFRTESAVMQSQHEKQRQSDSEKMSAGIAQIAAEIGKKNKQTSKRKTTKDAKVHHTVCCSTQ